MGDNALASARRSSRIRHAVEQGTENELLGFITPTPRPSEKALGKRPQTPIVHHAATPPDDNHGSRKATRILPSRTSRKSQGTLMVDELLLDYEQRSAAAKTSLPSTTSILLTTDASIIPPPLQTDRHVSYGGQPQSNPGGPSVAPESAGGPNFIQLTAASAVGSRLRVRETDAVSDTSDQAYLARHRRFEALEKRQRLREKEKIQHERYKLKERIEQLRAIPAQAFLKNQRSAPLSGEQLAQGEHTRRELLREAEELERRYDLLLSKEREQQTEDIRPPSLTIKVRLGSAGTRTPPAESSRPGAVTFAASHHAVGAAHQLTASMSNPIGRSSVRLKGTSRSSSPEQTRTSHNKRARHSVPLEALSYAEIESHAPSGYVPDILRVAAPTNASRTTGRASLPFGVKAPPILEDQNDFELPPDILGDRTSVPSDGGLPELEGHQTEDAGHSEDETLGLLAPVDDEY